MNNVRIFYKKRGRAKYISHLDLVRFMQRAFKKAGVPIWYTQGFNPHPYMTFALPLSLGHSSECESVDLRVTEDIKFEETLLRLKETMTPLEPYKIAFQSINPDKITHAVYQITVPEGGEAFGDKIKTFFGEKEVLVTKKTKKSEKQINLIEQAELIELSTTEDESLLTLKLAAGNVVNLNPELLLGAIFDYCGKKERVCDINRVKVLANGEEFC